MCRHIETGVVAWTVLLFTMVAIIDFLVMCVALRDFSGVWGVGSFASFSCEWWMMTKLVKECMYTFSFLWQLCI